MPKRKKRRVQKNWSGTHTLRKAKKKANLNRREKAIINKAEQIAKRKGFSLFTFLRMDKLTHHKKHPHLRHVQVEKPQKKIEQPNTAVLPKNAVVINAPTPQSPLPPAQNEQITPPNEGFMLNKKTEKQLLLETELRNPVLRTDFDRVLRMINEEGIVSANKIKSKLNLEAGRLKECYQTLERTGAIIVEYPLFGPPKLISIEFEKAKKRMELLKRGIQPQDDGE